MAPRQVLLFVAMAVVAVACLTAQAAAMEWKVGDNDGWHGKFNETGWALGKDFRVGDTLRFTYTLGQHTVIEVNGADFRTCNLQGNRLGSWNSGDDVVTLDKPGRRWFICDKPNHCNLGMKLVVTVLEAGAPAPATPPPPPSQSSAHAGFSVAGAVVAAAAAAVAATLAL
ncbi:hypothetical protein PR202_gb12368 [Eleusine coracana subsp. coracana]|uniref:Phytocyanin domain-containing protein n=1 Tax=Eleusine coracana subsp. coracana TaxID=191504 RepID=A0AAV5EQV9_ELECO|nr:hypothetical protein QOZ80_7BG0587690 [Eleusine coracana subsp. coracana]GJN24615.1 hypothetical protein PR202_gb12368 [Eleusine coracana subsp. coracana]